MGKIQLGQAGSTHVVSRKGENRVSGHGDQERHSPQSPCPVVDSLVSGAGESLSPEA